MNKIHRNLLFLLANLLCCGKLIFAAFPFRFPSHFAFEGQVSSVSVLVFNELLSAGCFLFAGLFIKTQIIWFEALSLVISSGMFVSWMRQWHDSDHLFLLIWLWGGNLLLNCACLYSHYTLNYAVSEIQNLEKYKYQFKKA